MTLTSENLIIQLAFSIHGEVVPRAPDYTEIQGCSSPLYKVAQYSRPSTSTHFTSADSTNHGWKFDLQVVESVSVKAANTKGQLYVY